jgi:hypothetical protein
VDNYQFIRQKLPRDNLNERRPFARDAHQIKRPSSLDQNGQIGDVIVEDTDLRVVPKTRPFNQTKRDIFGSRVVSQL